MQTNVWETNMNKMVELKRKRPNKPDFLSVCVCVCVQKSWNRAVTDCQSEEKVENKKQDN